jgi:hypothetical protein
MIKARKKDIHKKKIFHAKKPIEDKTQTYEPPIKLGSEKDFKYYWNIIEIPTYIIISMSIIAVLIQAYGGEVLNRYLSWLGWIVSVGVFSYIGYFVAEKRKEPVRVAGKTGAYAGAISGFFSAIIGLLSFYMFPAIYEKSIQMAIEQGANPEMITSITKIALYAMLVLSPLISALVGAALAMIVAWFVIHKY